MAMNRNILITSGDDLFSRDIDNSATLNNYKESFEYQKPKKKFNNFITKKHLLNLDCDKSLTVSSNNNSSNNIIVNNNNNSYLYEDKEEERKIIDMPFQSTTNKLNNHKSNLTSINKACTAKLYNLIHDDTYNLKQSFSSKHYLENNSFTKLDVVSFGFYILNTQNSKYEIEKLREKSNYYESMYNDMMNNFIFIKEYSKELEKCYLNIFHVLNNKYITIL